ncbi:MAG: LysR substrate-binding domain-containing protein [Imperialibacter sp.]|uniref:LysR substrate-binding domain-containing protein n=1 Tax=Imperialibacter sp. TaxID=2038411 RepID=UPI003A86C0F6
MNLQQLEYIVALDNERSFSKASDQCHVTQPTLSMMIQKLESEYDIKIFDRSKYPVVPTETGKSLISQARLILQEVHKIQELVQEKKNTIAGDLQIGIIPTIAPYLLPLFIYEFTIRYPHIKLKISEHVTEEILEKLDEGKLDAGILVSPDDTKLFNAFPLYYEPFVVYSARKFDKELLLAEDIDPNELLLLEESHCFRSQIIQFCELRDKKENTLEFTSGSLETLRNLADKNLGITILPELSTLQLRESDTLKLKRFAAPEPFRVISLMTRRDFVKKRMITAFMEEIKKHIPEKFQAPQGQEIAYRRKEKKVTF